MCQMLEISQLFYKLKYVNPVDFYLLFNGYHMIEFNIEYWLPIFVNRGG